MTKYFELLSYGHDMERLILHKNNWEKTDLLLNLQSEVDSDSLRFFNEAKMQLKNHYPVQYLMNEEYFFGLKLFVDEKVLIPRPETEELVAMILKDYAGDELKVLDIGAGSGAISLALKANRPNWQVTASDISENALKVTKKNARQLDLNLQTIQSDLFENITEKFDIIVSNPPYIAEDERELMDASVLAYEPELALFADENGLALYRQIVSEVREYLNPRGCLYFEIGFKQGEQVVILLKNEFPTATIEWFKDLYDNQRMVRMRLND